jgi:predicted acylesterase/phospholipase RssA
MKKLGLTFAGGGGKGAYEIGVWKALKEYGIDKNITAVSGTSVGGLNGALFAIGDIEQGLKVWESMSPDKILQINPEKIISAIGMLHPSTRVLTALSSKLGFLKSEGIFGQKGLESIIRDSLKTIYFLEKYF